MKTDASRAPVADLDYHVPAGCGITGMMSERGELLPGEIILKSICNMNERGNGLGSGYAAYGIYPQFKDNWCFHVMCDTPEAKQNAADFIRKYFRVIHDEPIPTRKDVPLAHIPILWRYFLDALPVAPDPHGGPSAEADLVVKVVMDINRLVDGAFVFSSGKNMGIFKGVGYPGEIGEFYRIPDYKAYIWTAHNRFPTNSVGWWGGAHPFGLLDWSLIHNGEISSYGINRRYLENYGYYCTLSTDTEVMAYLFDLIVRKHALDFETAGRILAAPFWTQIDRVTDPEEKKLLKALRVVYSPALVTGPFAVVVADSTHMVGLNDRVKLRPLIAARKGDIVFIASEEAAVRCVCPDPDRVWMPDAGTPTVARLKT